MVRKLYLEMIKYYSDDPKRTQHFVKVHAFSKLIGENEGLSERELFILECAALVHDIGIKVSEEKYGDTNGKHQELEGPPVARDMMTRLGFEDDVIERVCYLVGHHHTYSNIDALDYQILVEADFLVNLYEDDSPMKAVTNAYERIFKTETGRKICRNMYNF